MPYNMNIVNVQSFSLLIFVSQCGLYIEISPLGKVPGGVTVIASHGS